MLKYIITTHHVLALVLTFVDDPQVFVPTGRYALEQASPAKPTEPVNEPSPAPMAHAFSIEVWSASWCAYCPAAIAEAKAAAADLGIPFTVIDYDQNRAVLAQAGIEAPPTVCIVNSGKIQERIPGGAKRADIVARVHDWQHRWGQPMTHPSAPVAAPLPGVSYGQRVRSSDIRYIKYGRLTHDMETWSPWCSMNNCDMCTYLNQCQQTYRDVKRDEQQAAVEPPSPQSSSPDDVIDEALAIMKLTPSDVVAELGSGSGTPSIRMAKETGCKVYGVEIDPVKVAESRKRVQDAGVSDLVTIIEGDVLQFDPAAYGATAIYAYLDPLLLSQITPALSVGRVAVFPGHKPDGIETKLVGQCWVRL